MDIMRLPKWSDLDVPGKTQIEQLNVIQQLVFIILMFRDFVGRGGRIDFSVLQHIRAMLASDSFVAILSGVSPISSDVGYKLRQHTLVEQKCAVRVYAPRICLLPNECMNIILTCLKEYLRRFFVEDISIEQHTAKFLTLIDLSIMQLRYIVHEELLFVARRNLIAYINSICYKKRAVDLQCIGTFGGCGLVVITQLPHKPQIYNELHKKFLEPIFWGVTALYVIVQQPQYSLYFMVKHYAQIESVHVVATALEQFCKNLMLVEQGMHRVRALHNFQQNKQCVLSLNMLEALYECTGHLPYYIYLAGKVTAALNIGYIRATGTFIIDNNNDVFWQPVNADKIRTQPFKLPINVTRVRTQLGLSNVDPRHNYRAYLPSNFVLLKEILSKMQLMRSQAAPPHQSRPLIIQPKKQLKCIL